MTSHNLNSSKKPRQWQDFLSTKLGIVLSISLLSAGFSIIAYALLPDTPFPSLLLANFITFSLFIYNLSIFKKRSHMYLYLITTILKLALLLFNAKYKIPFIGGVDWANFDMYAQAAINEGSIFGILQSSLDLFVFLIALIYKIFGTDPTQIYFYIFPLSLLLLRYIYKTAYLIIPNAKKAVIAGVIFLLWPIDILFSVSLLREIPIQLFVIASFYHFLYYSHFRKTSHLVVALILAACASWIHSGMIGLLLVYIYAALQLKFYKQYKVVRLSAIMTTIVFTLILVFTPIWNSISTRFDSITSGDGVVTAIDKQDEYLSNAKTNYIDDSPDTLPELVSSIPYRLVMFAFAPFPWQIRDIGTIVTFVFDTLLQLYVLFIIVRTFKMRARLSLKQKNTFLLLVSSVLSVYLVFSLGTANYGTAVRHRAKVAPLVVILISAYGTRRQRI